jgi:hypothetical protein
MATLFDDYTTKEQRSVVHLFVDKRTQSKGYS